MFKRPVSSSKAPSAVGPYSQGLEVDGFLFLSGQIPIDPATGQLVDDIKAATTRVIERIKALAEAAGASLDNVVKTTVFLADMADFAAMNEVYAQYFKEPYPARSTIQVAALPKGARVEIESIIKLDHSTRPEH